MSRRLKVKYEDFISESLYIKGFDAILKEMAKKNRVATILSFLMNSESYKDDETINFLNLAPSINMITYIPPNRRIDNIWDSPGKTEIRIGRAVRQILNKLKPEDFNLTYKGKVCIETREMYSDEGNEGRTTLIFSKDLTEDSFAKQIESGFEIISHRPEYDQMSTEITIKIGDNVIKSNISDYSDECYVLQWDGYSDRVFFRIFLDKYYNIGSPKALTTGTRIDDIEECKKFTYDCEIELVTKAAGKSISEINDSDIEQFVNEFMAQMKVIRADEDSKIEMVNGEGIRKWYNSTNYQSTTGQLGGSCMAGDECQKFLDIYVKNPEVVSLLILKNKEGKLIGRSLLWKLDDGKYFMDRVYCATDYDTKLFTKYANDMGYYYRNNGGNNTITIYLNEEKVAPSFSVHLKEYDLEYYPYMDTLKDLDMSGVLSYNNREYDDDRELRDTEGKWVDFYEEED